MLIELELCRTVNVDDNEVDVFCDGNGGEYINVSDCERIRKVNINRQKLKKKAYTRSKFPKSRNGFRMLEQFVFTKGEVYNMLKTLSKERAEEIVKMLFESEKDDNDNCIDEDIKKNPVKSEINKVVGEIFDEIHQEETKNELTKKDIAELFGVSDQMAEIIFNLIDLDRKRITEITNYSKTDRYKTDRVRFLEGELDKLNRLRDSVGECFEV